MRGVVEQTVEEMRTSLGVFRPISTATTNPTRRRTSTSSLMWRGSQTQRLGCPTFWIVRSDLTTSGSGSVPD